MLTRIEVRRLRLPLTTPYHLAFGDVEGLDTILAVLRDGDGREGYGDATVLTGYTDETIEASWPLAERTARRLVGVPLAAAKAEALAMTATAPFVATAFASAIEMLEGAELLRIDRDTAVPVLGTINDSEPGRMQAQIDRLCGEGYTTLKIKVGSATPAADAERIGAALAHVAGRAMLRVDANQSYSPSEAIAFANAVPVAGIELFEQPCSAGDWAAHMIVARDCPLPLMLDESIYDEADIDETARLEAARFVKVKLMKFGTLERLAAAIERIRSHGMQPVLGNGVASDVGCWMETCIAARHINNAGEMNGWLKMTRPIFATPMRVSQGAIHLPAGYRPVLDMATVEAATLARAEAHA
ncbi:MAG: mandelate racemase [Methylibium sp.]|uniref:mandelate racemase/muconate lactonizing enzyme family protein n=1 Tax=Methylibium sp. TaxID=2067992 RepID=UPI00184F2187|nr:enolase C-terminal domain-like protein [Methylibium sp.]MBA3596153.1 mandelate racemase [Methylibium sp.]